MMQMRPQGSSPLQQSWSIQVTGSLVVDPHESLRSSRTGSRCGPQGCLELHPVAAITLLNDPGQQ